MKLDRWDYLAISGLVSISLGCFQISLATGFLMLGMVSLIVAVMGVFRDGVLETDGEGNSKRDKRPD